MFTDSKIFCLQVLICFMVIFHAFDWVFRNLHFLLGVKLGGASGCSFSRQNGGRATHLLINLRDERRSSSILVSGKHKCFKTDKVWSHAIGPSPFQVLHIILVQRSDLSAPLPAAQAQERRLCFPDNKTLPASLWMGRQLFTVLKLTGCQLSNCTSCSCLETKEQAITAFKLGLQTHSLLFLAAQ